MANKSEHTKKALLEALEKSLGIVTTACKIAGVSRSIYYKHYNSDGKFRAQCDDIQEQQKDFVESQLFQLIKDKNPACVIFFMKTKAKDRGYIERQEITGKNGKPLNESKTDYSKLSTKELEQLYGLLRKANTD